MVDTPMVWIPHDRSTVQLLHMQRNVNVMLTMNQDKLLKNVELIYTLLWYPAQPLNRRFIMMEA